MPVRAWLPTAPLPYNFHIDCGRHLVGDDQVDMRQLERDTSVLLGEVDASGVSSAAMAGVIDTIDVTGCVHRDRCSC